MKRLLYYITSVDAGIADARRGKIISLEELEAEKYRNAFPKEVGAKNIIEGLHSLIQRENPGLPLELITTIPLYLDRNLAEKKAGVFEVNPYSGGLILGIGFWEEKFLYQGGDVYCVEKEIGLGGRAMTVSFLSRAAKRKVEVKNYFSRYTESFMNIKSAAERTGC